MKNKKIERAGKKFWPRLQIFFLYGIFFVILKILDQVLDLFLAYNR